MFPPNGAKLDLASGGDSKFEPIGLKITGGTGPISVLVNGIPSQPAFGKRALFFTPDGPGFLRLTVMDARGRADSVVLRLQ
jgi:penicillin-binding protein 1C